MWYTLKDFHPTIGAPTSFPMFITIGVYLGISDKMTIHLVTN
jgi:hypothetical protein